MDYDIEYSKKRCPDLIRLEGTTAKGTDFGCKVASGKDPLGAKVTINGHPWRITHLNGEIITFSSRYLIGEAFPWKYTNETAESKEIYPGQKCRLLTKKELETGWFTSNERRWEDVEKRYWTSTADHKDSPPFNVFKAIKIVAAGEPDYSCGEGWSVEDGGELEYVTCTLGVRARLAFTAKISELDLTYFIKDELKEAGIALTSIKGRTVKEEYEW